ncbi:MAG: hypothetical protein ACI89X_004253, partial [Planctomycetota bacterium]
RSIVQLNQSTIVVRVRQLLRNQRSAEHCAQQGRQD